MTQSQRIAVLEAQVDHLENVLAGVLEAVRSLLPPDLRDTRPPLRLAR